MYVLRRVASKPLSIISCGGHVCVFFPCVAQEWKACVCVLVQGAAWQFKGWEWDQPVTLFQNGERIFFFFSSLHSWFCVGVATDCPYTPERRIWSTLHFIRKSDVRSLLRATGLHGSANPRWLVSVNSNGWTTRAGCVKIDIRQLYVLLANPWHFSEALRGVWSSRRRRRKNRWFARACVYAARLLRLIIVLCVAAIWRHGALSRAVRESYNEQHHGLRLDVLPLPPRARAHSKSPWCPAVLGVHMKFDDVRVNDKVSQWNVRVLEVSFCGNWTSPRVRSPATNQIAHDRSPPTIDWSCFLAFGDGSLSWLRLNPKNIPDSGWAMCGCFSVVVARQQPVEGVLCGNLAHVHAYVYSCTDSSAVSLLVPPPCLAQINKHKRHLDKGAVLEFWRLLDEFMLLNKPEMMA